MSLTLYSVNLTLYSVNLTLYSVKCQYIGARAKVHSTMHRYTGWRMRAYIVNSKLFKVNPGY